MKITPQQIGKLKQENADLWREYARCNDSKKSAEIRKQAEAKQKELVKTLEDYINQKEGANA